MNPARPPTGRKPGTNFVLQTDHNIGGGVTKGGNPRAVGPAPSFRDTKLARHCISRADRGMLRQVQERAA